MDINYDMRTRSQLYKFTNTSLFINYKEYPYVDLRIKSFHPGNKLMNSWYSLESSNGKKLVVGYKPTVENEKKLKPIFDYIASYDEKKSNLYLKKHRSFEFIVDDGAAFLPKGSVEALHGNIHQTISSYLSSDKNFSLSDKSFEGDIVLDESDGQKKVEIYMHGLFGASIMIGYVPSDLLAEMNSFLEEGIRYELRLVAIGHGMIKKEYIISALLKFDKS